MLRASRLVGPLSKSVKGSTKEFAKFNTEQRAFSTAIKSKRNVPTFTSMSMKSTTSLSRNPAQRVILSRGFASYPDHSQLGLPALSPSMETGNLVKWRKQEGDKVKAGDIIAEVETDKATVDFEVTDEGYLAKILISEGTKDIPVGKPIAIIVENQADIAAFKDYKVSGAAPAAAAPKKAEAPVEAPKAEAPKAETPKAAAPSQPVYTNVVPGAPPPPGPLPKLGFLASPLAKTVAAQSGIDVAQIKGSGPGGRVLYADVAEQATQSRPSTTGSVAPSTSGVYEDIPNSQIRKVTAQRLTLSKQTIPHYYLTIECNVDALLKMRTELNDKANNAFKLSVNDFVIKAAALALKKVPAVNSSWSDEAIRRYNNVDINVAVNTEKGLFTPIVKDADKIGLSSISNKVKELADKAKSNKLQPSEFQGGTFTISNLGMFGIKTFAAVINPPQACILAVGGTEKRVVLDEKAKDPSNPYKVANYMSLTLSCDHRVVDGAIGAEWLKSFREYLEDPVKMLL